jgi:hypothetical protein
MSIIDPLRVVGRWVLDLFGVSELIDLPQDVLEIVELLGIDNPLDPGEEIDFGITGSMAGWIEKDYVSWYKGQRKVTKVWFKPKEDMNEMELRGYYQALRHMSVSKKQAVNDAYKRGFNDGAEAQSRHEAQVEAGVTPPVTYKSRRWR